MTAVQGTPGTISASDLAEQWGWSTRTSGSGRNLAAVVSGSGQRISLSVNQRAAEVNGIKVFLGIPASPLGNGLGVSARDVSGTLRPIARPRGLSGVPRLYRIVIDPGHGGSDPGAINAALGLNEKTTTLDVARRLRAYLGEYGYRVFLTREDDSTLSLDARAAMANRVRADLFLSLHFNAVDSPSVAGVETYVMTLAGHASTNAALSTASNTVHPGNRNDPWNAMVGYAVQQRMVTDLGGADRGLRRARFSVLRQVSCPAALVEGGFLSNPAEARRIGTEVYRDQLARALLKAILQYQGQLNQLRQ